MKKTLILASAMILSVSTVFAADAVTTPAKDVKPCPAKECKKMPPRPDVKRHREFEQRLKLSDVQKEQAREIRMKGHEEIKPLMDKLWAKKMEADAVRKSKIAPQAQEEKLAKIREEKMELKKQIHELRQKNMKEFESILTRKQRKELEKMKKEGRKRFEREHGREYRPGFGPGFGPGPAMPPKKPCGEDFPPPPPPKQ